MKNLLVILALFIAGYAHADSNAGALALSSAQTQSAAAVKANNEQIINFNSPEQVRTRVSGETTLKTVATVYAPPIGVTAPCFVGYSGGVTVVGFGASLGGNVEDTGCTLRETSRLLYGIGQVDAAARVMCANADAARAMGPAVCPVALTKETPVSAATSSCYADPIVAARNNAPVCK